MVREGLRPPLLIFVQSVERAMQLFHALVYDGLFLRAAARISHVPTPPEPIDGRRTAT
jgi:hypothetical protein